MSKQKHKGLLQKSISDNVTHAEMQSELARLREAVSILTTRLGNELGDNDARRILELLAPPEAR